MEFIKTENFAETFQTGSEGLAETSATFAFIIYFP